MADRAVASVIVDSPLPQLDRAFDFEIPESLRAVAVAGVRVRVPVRAARRVMDGWIVGVSDSSDYPGTLSEVAEVVSPVPVLAPEVARLARAVADRAVGTVPDVLRLAIPKRQARVEQQLLSGAVWASEAPVTPHAVHGYAQLGQLVAEGRRVVAQAISQPGAWARTLAEAASIVVARGDSAIIAVPDRRDIELLQAVLAEVVDAARIVRLDADQSAPARYRAFLRARTEDGLVIVGTRSVVYAPASRLGLLAMWNDGDQLFREPLSPGVHPRDAALIRHEQQGGALLLLANSPSVEAARLVDIGWCLGVRPDQLERARMIPAAMVLGGDELAERARIPSSAWRIARAATERGPVLVQVARPGVDAPGGSLRTASDLGRAFPRTPVIVSDGERRVTSVRRVPSLVIATRGAEPYVEGGYEAVLLLDGERMLAREALRTAEDCMRTWSDAAAMCAASGTVVLAGVSGRLATALKRWRQDEFARAELEERVAVRMPPAVRVASLTGTAGAIEEAIAAAEIPPLDVMGTTRLDDGAFRTIIRFDYRRGAAVAAALRAELLRHAAGRRTASGPSRGRAPLPLRVRMDDQEPFDGAWHVPSVVSPQVRGGE